MAIEKIQRPCEACGGHSITKYRGHLTMLNNDESGLITLHHKSGHESYSEHEVSGSKLEAVRLLWLRLSRKRNLLLQELCAMDRGISLCDAEIAELEKKEPEQTMKDLLRAAKKPKAKKSK
jgi:hypothetical protein